eukprot:3931600-Pleurochrysis_carterae.AAC.1
MPMFSTTVPAVPEPRRPFFVERVGSFRSLWVALFEWLVVCLARSEVGLSEKGTVASVRIERAFLLARFELTQNVTNSRDSGGKLAGGARHSDLHIE